MGWFSFFAASCSQRKKHASLLTSRGRWILYTYVSRLQLRLCRGSLCTELAVPCYSVWSSRALRRALSKSVCDRDAAVRLLAEIRDVWTDATVFESALHPFTTSDPVSPLGVAVMASRPRRDAGQTQIPQKPHSFFSARPFRMRQRQTTRWLALSCAIPTCRRRWEKCCWMRWSESWIRAWKSRSSSSVSSSGAEDVGGGAEVQRDASFGCDDT